MESIQNIILATIVIYCIRQIFAKTGEIKYSQPKETQDYIKGEEEQLIETPTVTEAESEDEWSIDAKPRRTIPEIKYPVLPLTKSVIDGLVLNEVIYAEFAGAGAMGYSGTTIAIKKPS